MKMYEQAQKKLNYILDSLKNDRCFYECDINCEYTSFEESLKSYCDSYGNLYIQNNDCELFFSSLKSIVEAIVECLADMYDEDFFRPAELITYYFGKIVTNDISLKDEVYNWLSDFCRKYDGDMLVVEYFEPFINGESIYHADDYYTGYDDLKEMMSVFK